MPIVTSKMSQVQFERFEFEDDPSLLPSQRNLIFRAEPRNWVGPTLAYMMQQSANNLAPRPVKHIDFKARNNWWGAYHVANERLSNRFISQSPLIGEGQAVRSRVLHHEACWDERAVSTNATEIVLEKLTGNGVQELGALLIRSTRNFKQQELVFAQDESWRAPLEGEEMLAKEMVTTMARIALGGNIAATS